jgi:hypothetical protein
VVKAALLRDTNVFIPESNDESRSATKFWAESAHSLCIIW